MLEASYAEYIAENGLDALLEDIGSGNDFEPLDVNGQKYIYCNKNMKLQYKGEVCNVSIYYNRKLGQFNKNSLNQVINAGAEGVAQAQANHLPSKPELILWDANGILR